MDPDQSAAPKPEIAKEDTAVVASTENQDAATSGEEIKASAPSGEEAKATSENPTDDAPRPVEGLVKLQGQGASNESENESEELDDIELIFTTEETCRETVELQEDLVSITDSDNWQQQHQQPPRTPTLVRFSSSSSQFFFFLSSRSCGSGARVARLNFINSVSNHKVCQFEGFTEVREVNIIMTSGLNKYNF